MRSRWRGLAFAFLVCLPLAWAPVARASVDPLGNPHGRDLTQLRRGFLAGHRRGYRIVGYHASLYYRFKFAGVYFLERRGGVNVGSGVEIFHRTRRGWRADRHPGKGVEYNLEPDTFFYTASLSGTGSYLSVEESDIDEPELHAATRVEIQLDLFGRFGAGREKLEVTPGAEQPEPEAPRQLFGGSGTTAHTDAARPEDDYSCTYHLVAGTDQTSLSIGWRGQELDLALSLGSGFGDGGGSGETECGGTPEDPLGEDSSLEVHARMAHPPTGRPFDVPLSLDHHRSSSGRNEETGALSSVEERALKLQGSLHFGLVGLEPPYLN